MRRLLALTLVAMTACGLSVVGVAPEPLTEPPDPDAAADAPSGDAHVPPQDAGSDTRADADADADADPGPPPLVFGDECPAGTVYDEDFSTDPATRWKVIAGTWEWSAAKKTYTLKPLKADGTDDVGVVWIGARPKWKDYDVDVTETVSLPPNDHGDVGPLLRVGDIPKKTPQPANDGTMYLAAAQLQTGTNLILGKFSGGNYTGLQGNNDGFDTTKRLTVHATVAGSTLKAWLNDDTAKAITATDSTYAAGAIGIRAFKSPVVLERVTVTCR